MAKTSWPDPRLHTLRLWGVFSQADFKPTHAFPLTVNIYNIYNRYTQTTYESNLIYPSQSFTHLFPLTKTTVHQELIAFANDVEESLWYGWNKLSAAQGDYSIYCFDEHPKVYHSIIQLFNIEGECLSLE